MNPEIFNCAEAAAYLGLDARTVKKLVDRGEIVAWHPMPQLYRIHRETLDALIKGGSPPENKRGEK